MPRIVYPIKPYVVQGTRLDGEVQSLVGCVEGSWDVYGEANLTDYGWIVSPTDPNQFDLVTSAETIEGATEALLELVRTVFDRQAHSLRPV